MQPLIAPTIAARRTRAAMEYAGLKWTDLADRTGISRDIIRRIVSLTSPRGFKNSDECEAIARACKVPTWFLAEGFAGQAVGRADDDLAESIRSLRVAVGELAVDSLRHTRELQALRDTGRREERRGERE